MKSFLRTAVAAVALGALPTLSLAGGDLVIPHFELWQTEIW